MKSTDLRAFTANPDIRFTCSHSTCGGCPHAMRLLARSALVPHGAAFVWPSSNGPNP